MSDEQKLKSNINNINNFFQNGKYKEAKDLAINATNNFPNNNICWKILSLIHAKTGDLKEALTSISMAIKIVPTDIEALSNKGLILFKLMLLEEAKTSYEKVLKLDKDNADAHNNLGVIYQKKGDLKKAEYNYKKALKIKPNFAVAYNNLGNTLKDLDVLDEAEDCYRKAIELNPDYTKAQKNLDLLLNENELLKLLQNKKKISTKKSKIGLKKNPFISHRAIESNLLSSLYKINSTELSKTEGGPLYGKGSTTDYQLFKNDMLILSNVQKDLVKVMKDSVGSDIYILDSFLNILQSGGGSFPHTHILSFDKNRGLVKKKFSLVYYISVGDQNNTSPGFFKINDPDEEILPNDGMIIIIPADRKHSAVYNGKIDRVMIGINFYSLN